MSDDELDIELRSPADVAARCIILASLIRRLSIESLANEQRDDELAGEAFDIPAWLQAENLWDRVGDAEATFFEQPLGSLSEDQMASVAWQAEGLASLGWSIGLAVLPPIGDLGHVVTVLKVAPSPWDKTSPWIGNTTLQPESDIARERDLAELIEWRVSVESPFRAASGQERAEYREAIADVASEAKSAGLADVSGDDLVFAGSPLVTLNDDGLERLMALAEERLRALNWVCGFGDSWDSVPLDI